MSRGLSPGELAVLEANDYITEEHLKITIRSFTIVGSTITYTPLTTYRYTTGPNDTVVSGDGTYIPQSYVSNLTYADESYELIPATVNLTFETFESSFINSLDIDAKFATLIDIYKVFKNPSTLAVDGRFNMFSGHITGIDITGSKETQSVTLRCSSNFSQFEKKNGRTLSSLPQWPLYEPIFWGQIKV